MDLLDIHQTPGPAAAEADGEFHATVNRVLFGPTADNYAVYAVTLEGGKTTRVQVTGTVIADSGDRIVIRGAWGSYKGQPQIKAEMIQLDIPKNSKGIVKWLKGGAVEGVADRTVEKLLGVFGERLPEIVSDEAAMAEVVGAKKAKAIARAWGNNNLQPELTALLLQVGLKPKQVAKAIEMFGAAAKRIIETDPWELLEVDGIGFPTADAVARAKRLDMASPNRVQRGFHWGLSEILSREGHTGYPPNRLVQRISKLLSLSQSIVEAALPEYLESDNVVHDRVLGLVYPRLLWEAERDIAEAIGRMARVAPTEADLEAARAVVLQAEKELDVELDRDGGQFDAAVLAVASPLCIITGGPGTGKSTTQRVIVHARKLMGHSVRLGAPTGRAAKRLSDTSGQEAKTIHRLLEYQPSEGSFKFCSTNTLPVDHVILDETSMVDTRIFSCLAVAMRAGAGLTLVGDVDQLPSVGPGQVLKDLIESGAIPVARLTRVHRQAEGSGIAIAAKRINTGESPLVHGETLRGFTFVESRDSDIVARIVHLVRSKLPEAGFDPLRDVQILTAMRKGESGVEALNAAIKQALNPALDDGRTQLFAGRAFTIGDRVMQQRNDYTKGIYNGEVGTVTALDQTVDKEGRRIPGILVDFSGTEARYKGDDHEDIALAYAATIHRSQGCEFPVVVMAVAEEHRHMLIRNLVYTGLTRARLECHMIGSGAALRHAVLRAEGTPRFTGLKQRIAEFAMAA